MLVHRLIELNLESIAALHEVELIDSVCFIKNVVNQSVTIHLMGLHEEVLSEHGCKDWEVVMGEV